MKHPLRIVHRRALPLLFAIALTFAIVATVSAAVVISATKTYTIIGDDGDGKADPGETIGYTVAVKNNGDTDAAGVTLNDVIDANTTLVNGSVNVSPLAINDSYDTIGNTLLEVGVAAGPAPAVHVSSNLFANDAEFLADAGTFNITAHTTPANGTLVAFNSGTGTFAYLPNPGFSGADSFTYTLTDAGGLTDTATVTINVNAQRVWYVKNDAPAGGLGRSTDPFDTLAEAQAASAVNDTIYIFQGDGTTTGQNAGIALKSGQRLLGEGVALTVPVSVNGGANPTMLRAAGGQPRVDNTSAGGNGVSATDLVPAEIRGLGLSGTANAIDVTITTAAAGTLQIKDNTLFGAGAEGIDINKAGAGTLTLDVQNNTWNAAGTHTGNAFDARTTFGFIRLNISNNTNILSSATGVFLDGSGGGVITVTGFANNTISGNTAGNGISANVVAFDNDPATAGFQTVSGGTTVIGASGNGVDTSGMLLTNVTGDLSFTDLDIYAANGAGLKASSTATFNAGTGTGFQITVGAGVATINASSGPAVDLTTVTAALPFANIASSNSTSTGVSLTSVLGSFSAPSSSSITNATGTDFAVSNSNATITYGGSISDASGSGVNLSNNTGSTISFSGPLTLSSGASATFSATGGGTISATDPTSTLASTTGTALNVANTTISASGLTFRSISANGATKGIILNTTGSGGLSVTGTGTTDGSGGTIQNISTRGAEFVNASNLSLKNMNFTNANNSADSGAAGVCDDLTTTACNAAIYLNNVSTVALDNLNVTGTMVEEGINGNTVSNFTLSNSTISNCGNEVEEGCIKMRGLTGTSSISGSDISFPGADVVEIVNTSGSLLLNVNNSTFRDSQASASGSDGIQLRNQGTASGIINVNSSTFLRIRTVGLHVQAINSGSGDVDVTGSTFDPDTGTMIGVDLDADNTATLKFNIQNNPKIYSRNGPAVNIFGDTNAVIDGRINNNPDVQVKANAGSNVGSGIRANLNKDARGRIEIKNNVVNVGSDDAGIDVSGIGKTTANPGGATNTLDSTITGNNVTIGATSTYGIMLIAASNAGDTNTMCSNVASNTITRNPSSIASFRARVANASGFQRLQGFNTNAEVTWNSNGNTPNSAGGSEVSYGGSGTFAACTATLPTNPALTPSAMAPSSDSALAQYPAEDNRMAYSYVSNGDTTSADDFAPAFDLGSMYQTAAWVAPSAQSASPAAPISSDSDDRKAGLFALPAAPALSGETVNVAIGNLPVGKTVTITFRVSVNNPLPPGVIRILNQSNVTYTGGPVGGVNTVDPTPNPDPACAGSGTQTCTPVDRPDTNVVSLTRQSANPTNAATVTWQVVFANPVDGLTASNFALANTGLGGAPAITGVTPTSAAPATTWNITASTGTGQGTLGLNLVNDTGLSHDITNLPFTGEAYDIDQIAPTVTNVTSGTNTGCILNTFVYYCNASDVVNIQVVFSEPVNVDTTGGTPTLALNTGAVATYGGGSGTNTLTFNYTVAAGQNAVDLDYTSTSGLALNGAVIADAATNSATLTLAAPGAAGSLSANTDIAIDTITPTVSYFHRRNPLTSPTNSDTLQFEVDFSERLGAPGLIGSDDFIVTGTTATITGIGVVDVNAGTYYIDIAGGDLANLNGTVGLNFSPGMLITDRAGNPVANVEPADDQTYLLDNTAPTVTIDQAAGQADPTNTSPINFKVLFSEPVSGFATGDVTLSGTAGATTASVTEIAPNDGTTYTVAVSGMTSDGTVIASIPAGVATDGVNLNVAFTSTDNSVTYDTAPPAVTIEQAAGQADPTGSSPINFTVVFNEPVTGFSSGDVTLAGTAGATTASVTEIAPNDGTTYTVAVSGMASDGTVIASITGGVAQDLAGNSNVASTSTDNTILYDTTPPDVTVDQAVGQADPTNAATINFTVNFSEAVSGFATGDVDLSASTAPGTLTGTVTGGPAIYNVVVTGMTGGGTVVASIPAGVATDLASKPNNASTSTDNTVTYDASAPTVTIDQSAGQADPTNSSTINFVAVFSEPVTGLTGADVTLAGTAGATTATVSEIAPNDGTTYAIAVSGMAADGTVIPSISAGTAQDAAGNNNTASTSTDNSVTYDASAPSVTIDQAAGQADPTNGTPINFVAVFSEPVTGLTGADVTLAGTAGATTATVSEIAPNDGTTYSIAVSGMASDGTVIASISGGVVQDAAGNSNSASTSTDNTVTYDASAPTVALSSAAPDPTNTSPIPVTVQFSEPVTGFVVGDISAGNGTVGNFVAVDGDTYTFDLTPSGQGAVTADIAAGVAQDAAGNGNTAAAQFSRTYDTIAPTVALSSAAPDPTNTSPIPVTVQFSEPVTGFAAGDISAGNGTAGNFVAVDGDTYTFDLTPSGQGAVTADIAAGVAQDAAGNGNTAAAQFSRTYDTIAPTVTIDQTAGQADPTNAAPINFVAVFSEPVTGLIGADITLAGTAGATTATVTEIAPNDGTTYSIAVGGMTSSGTVIASIPAGAARDAAGNPNTASTSSDNTVTFDPVFPVVTGIVRADPSPTNAASVQFSVTFAKSVSGVDASDFSFTSSGVSGATVTNIAGSGTSWTVTVDTGTGDGTLRLDVVDDDTIVDAASNPLGGKGLGNGNFTSGEVYTIDRTAPGVAAITRANASPTNAATVDFTITFTEIVTGVDAGDFSLATSGVTGASISSIAGSGTTWTVKVNTGSGSGTIGLNLADDDTIVDQAGNVLGGKGAGNGSFSGEVYSIDKIAPQAGNLAAASITTGGGATQTFTVVFSDDLAIDIASLDGSDIRVTGPGGFSQAATLLSVTPATNGSPRTATYEISAPGGAWDNADNGTYMVTLASNQVSDTAGNTAAAGTLGSFDVNVPVARRLVYLPLIMHSAAQAPDLVVSSVTLSPNKTSFTTSDPVQISVVIKNQGNAPTTPFWVDLYLNPSRTPELNLIWSQLCSLNPCYGIAWQVTQPLAPGAEITLTSTVGSFAAGYTNWHDRLAAGTTDLYVQVDSWNPGKTIGASGDANLANNLYHIGGLHVTGQNRAATETRTAIPARPAAGQR